MAYRKQNFVNGSTVLTAEHMNHIEDGIIEKEQEIEVERARINQIVQTNTGEATGENAELIDIRIGANGVKYPTAGEAVREQVNQISEENASEILNLSAGINDKANYLSIITNGHFKSIPYSFHTKGKYYQEIDGAISIRGQLPSSGIISAPKNLCLDFGNDSRCFLYFYTKDESGDYVATFDVFNITTNNIKNYVTATYVESRMIKNIPDNTYMEICYDKGMVELYGWDGEPFGMDVCATCSIPTTDNEEAWLFMGGDSGITLHGKSKHIISNGAVMKLVHGYKAGKQVQLSGSTKNYYKLPEGYDYFRIRIHTTEDETQAKTLSGDVRDLFHIVAEESEERPISNAKKVIDNCKKVSALAWKPKKSLVVNSKTTIHFKPNVAYNGLIYSGQWDRAHYIGWHVSPHTFVNAMNDEDSIMYTEKADNGETGDNRILAPFYGTVCSAFATMCDGWDHPQTNAGFFYDPDIEKYYAHKPPIGQIYTDIISHCVVPSGITQIGDDSVVSAYESVRPTSVKTTRFMSITWQDIWLWWNASAGLDYYNNYGYVVHNPRAKVDMSFVPYADFDNAYIVNGSARPHKGDRSVYTSDENDVKINIKDSNAKTLYLESESGNIRQIPVSGTSMNVKSYLKADGIYHVYTDVDNTKESFEYIEVTPISYTLTDDSLTFDNNDFWYADCNMAGIHYYQKANGDYEKRNCSVLANMNGDYSKWFTNGNYVTSVNAVFKKGRYGAYTVPITR